MAGLIDQWRVEISESKSDRPRLDPGVLERFLRKAEDHGLAAGLVAITVLSCEWVFRIRRATEEDIERMLYEMEKGFCNPSHPILTPFQAHLLVKLLEPNLRKEIENLRITLVFGFETGTQHPGWSFFADERPREPKRIPPKQVVPRRRGPLPILGPIMAGAIVGTLIEEKSGTDGGEMGRELCKILLKRKVLTHEFDAWQKTISTLSNSWRRPPVSFSECVRQAYHQTFEMSGEAVSVEMFLERCKTDPGSVLSCLAHQDILKAVYSEKWG